MSPSPDCRFYRFYTKGRAPVRADRFAGGTLSMRAARYCDAVTTASGFGWWLFPPVNTILSWDGRMIVWSPGWIDDQHPTPNYRLVICLPGALRFIGSGGEGLFTKLIRS